MARELAKRSLCSRDRVGAVIVDVNQKVIGEGYNGPPFNFQHNDASCIQWCIRAMHSVSYREPDYSDCPALHAEANALMMSDRSLRQGGTIYVTSHPCMGCAKLIANSGLSHLYVYADRQHEYRRNQDVYDFLLNCGVDWNISESG